MITFFPIWGNNGNIRVEEYSRAPADKSTRLKMYTNNNKLLIESCTSSCP